jgi:heme-binding protein
MRHTVKRAGIVVAVLVAVIAAAGIVGPHTSNLSTDSTHAIQAQPGTSSALAAVLDRSCGDCHSNTVVSHWYARVPPFSTVLARGAMKGRKSVNFSEWTSYSPEQQRALLLASCADVKTGKMPGKVYLAFRRDAQLSTEDIAAICSAARPAASTPATSATSQARREP